MTRGGQKSTATASERRCIATGATRPLAEMVRFVVSPDGAITPDILGRLPGRGIWVSADAAAIDKAANRGLFARAAKEKVTVPPGLAATVERMVAARLIALIAMARKAGQAFAGFDKVKALLEDDELALLLQAHDGSEGQKRKLRPPRQENSYFSCLSGSELGVAFGRENVTHAGLVAGGLAKRVVEEAARLAGLHGMAPQKGRTGRKAAKDEETGTNER